LNKKFFILKDVLNEGENMMKNSKSRLKIFLQEKSRVVMKYPYCFLPPPPPLLHSNYSRSGIQQRSVPDPSFGSGSMFQFLDSDTSNLDPDLNPSIF
jgi:hypothetical protein